MLSFVSWCCHLRCRSWKLMVSTLLRVFIGSRGWLVALHHLYYSGCCDWFILIPILAACSAGCSCTNLLLCFFTMSPCFSHNLTNWLMTWWRIAASNWDTSIYVYISNDYIIRHDNALYYYGIICHLKAGSTKTLTITRELAFFYERKLLKCDWCLHCQVLFKKLYNWLNRLNRFR